MVRKAAATHICHFTWTNFEQSAHQTLKHRGSLAAVWSEKRSDTRSKLRFLPNLNLKAKLPQYFSNNAPPVLFASCIFWLKL